MRRVLFYFCQNSQTIHTLYSSMSPYNLSLYDTKSFILSFIHPRTYRVFKKCNFKFNAHFWRKNDLDLMYYSAYCQEKATFTNISHQIHKSSLEIFLAYAYRCYINSTLNCNIGYTWSARWFLCL